MNDRVLIDKLSREIGVKIPRTNQLKSPYISDFLGISTRLTKDLSIYKMTEQVVCCQWIDQHVVTIILAGIGFAQIPRTIFEFPHLENLILCNNKISDVHNSIANLSNLRFLDLSNNKIGKWPSAIEHLKSLTVLDLGFNKIKIIPHEINELQNLTSFFLSGNSIDEMSPSILDLQGLWDSHDLLQDVQAKKERAIVDQTYEKNVAYREEETNLIRSFRGGLFAHEAQISNLPPEVLSKNYNAIKEYWKSLEISQQLPLNEVKIILIGEGGSGKTSLLKRLTGNDFDANESQTHGINIKEWLLKTNATITARIWDFGGQEIMHSTHQFFLSKRSLYLIVLDSRKDEGIEYWLKHIESFGGDSPVLIVINKTDENPGFDVNRKFIQDKYPSIEGFYRVSCLTQEGIEELRNGIIDGLKNVKHLNTLWRREWFSVKNELQMSNKNYISISQYIDICRRHGISKPGVIGKQQCTVFGNQECTTFGNKSAQKMATRMHNW